MINCDLLYLINNQIVLSTTSAKFNWQLTVIRRNKNVKTIMTILFIDKVIKSCIEFRWTQLISDGF